MTKILWQIWDKSVFEQAKREGKLILLDIFGKWCHWCHVMSNTTYADPSIAKRINDEYIPINVDTDRRPDINDRYNQGGWPTTAVLDAEGHLLLGATYLPPDRFSDFLEQAKVSRPQPFHEQPLQRGEIGDDLVWSFLETVKGHFDPAYGGFGHEPKFPMTEVLEFLLALHADGVPDCLDIVLRSLRGMAGIFDPVAGGFYRYSVTRDWTLPHYEKMLETNGDLVGVLARTVAARQDPQLARMLEQTVAYLATTLSGSEGLYASQDAGAEDAYYGRTQEERTQVSAPAVDRTVFADLNGRALVGLLAAVPVVKSPALTSVIDRGFATLDRLWSPRQGMAHYADQGKPVFLGLLRDHMQAGLAYAAGAVALKNDAYRTRAAEITAFIDDRFRDRDGGYFDTLVGGEGALAVRLKKPEDNARMARLLVALGQKDHARAPLELFALRQQGILGGDYALAVKQLLGS